MIDHPAEFAEQVEGIRRDLTDPTMSLREIARRNHTSHSQVQRIRDEGVEPEGWRGLSAYEALQAACAQAQEERDDLRRMYQQMLADNMALVRKLRSELAEAYG